MDKGFLVGLKTFLHLFAYFFCNLFFSSWSFFHFSLLLDSQRHLHSLSHYLYDQVLKNLWPDPHLFCEEVLLGCDKNFSALSLYNSFEALFFTSVGLSFFISLSPSLPHSLFLSIPLLIFLFFVLFLLMVCPFL